MTPCSCIPLRTGSERHVHSSDLQFWLMIQLLTDLLSVVMALKCHYHCQWVGPDHWLRLCSVVITGWLCDLWPMITTRIPHKLAWNRWNEMDLLKNMESTSCVFVFYVSFIVVHSSVCFVSLFVLSDSFHSPSSFCANSQNKVEPSPLQSMTAIICLMRWMK